jgi:SnoaL-like domain
MDALQRLHRLEDFEAARGLLHAYATVLDEPDVATVTALFDPDATLTNPRGTFRGRDAIAADYRVAWDLDPSRKVHVIATPGLRHVSPGVVDAQAVFCFFGRGQDESVLGWGRYDDRIAVRDGRARFLAKRIRIGVRATLATGWAADES